MSINGSYTSATKWVRKINHETLQVSLLYTQGLPQQKVFVIPDHELPQDVPDQPGKLTLISCKI